MSQQIAQYIGKGISPRQFIDGMTKNQEKFSQILAEFEWNDPKTEAFFYSLNNRDDLRCAIIAADWCGDVVRNIPVVLSATEKAGIPTELFIMEQNLELIDQFLVMGGRSLPVVLITDTGGHVLGKWGPRPTYIQEPMVAFKRDNPDREAPDYQDKLAEARKEIMARYGEGTGYQKLILEELRGILSAV